MAEAAEEMADGPPEEEVLKSGPGDAELLGWFRDGHAALVETLRSADPGLSCWAFLDAPSPLAFWARRQAHETAIHRVDAELAAGVLTPVAADFAADGIDELIMGFAPREMAEPSPADGGTLQVRTTDSDDKWLIALGPKVVAARASARADCVVAGRAANLYLLLWNRLAAADAAVSITGDTGVLRTWQSSMRVRWE